MPLTDVDRSLLERCLVHEPGAWRDFVDRFLSLFVHVVQHTAHTRSVQLTQDDVDDLCSEVFLAILANDFAVLRHFRGQSSLATYLCVIARRVVVKEVAQRRMAEALGHVKAHSEIPDQYAAPNFQRVESRDLVQCMLQDLERTEAEIVRQYHLEGRTYQQISASLGVPMNSIGPTLTRARDKLRRIFPNAG